jgi:hypothetical protein
MSKELLRLWHRDSSENQESERLPLEAGTRGLVKNIRPGILGARYGKL